MVKEKDDIDDLISQAEMELSDSDVDKLISEVEGAGPPQPEEKEGYFSGINKAMDDKAMEYAQKNLKPERYPLQHAVQKFNSIVDIPLSGLSKAAEPVMPYVKSAAKGILEGAAFAGGNRRANPDGTTKAIGQAIAPAVKKYEEVKEKYPAVEAVGEVGQLAGNVVGLGGAGKVGTALGKETLKLPSKAGSGLVDAGKNFKLGDLKIKDTIAKKGYGKDLIEKKQNIANTIYEYGLSEGNHQAGAAKASQLLDDIFTKTDDIVTTISKDPMSPKKNPVQAMTKDLNIEALVDIDEEDAAQNFVESLKNKFAQKGLDQDLTLDKLVEAKKMLDRKGTLFKNGPTGIIETDVKTAIKKKMYLNLVSEIADISPELKALNTEAKKLFSAQDALSGAASRTANKDAISLTDWVMGASAVIDPKAIPALVVKKGLANGRGSNLMLNTGRALKGDKAKTIDDILAGVVKPEPQLQQPITDKRRLLPRQMMGESTQPIENMEIPIGAKIRNLGEAGDKITDNLAGGRYALPSPEEIKALYPDLSPEDVKSMLFKFDDKKALPAPMLGSDRLKTERPLPSMGDRIRALGESGAPEFDKPIVDRIALPSPEDIKKLYPSLSDEDAKKLIYQLNEARLLPAPMIDNSATKQAFQRQLPTLGQRLGSIGDLKGKKLSDVPFKVIKKK